MNRNNVEINIIINGRRVTEYQSPMDFQTYIEGREGSNFEIEFVNNNPFDVEAIISVDGLSVTDGKAAGSDSSGYMVPARGRVAIPGWTLDKGSVAKFFFSGAKGGSYVEQSGGDDRNKGVIGAKVFARKQRYIPSSPVFHAFGGTAGGGMLRSRGMSKGISSNNASYGGGVSASLSNSVSTSNAAIPFSLDSASAGAWTDDQSGLEAVEQSLGTGFGDATDFKTTTVEFERGDLTALIEVFYDDAQGLKRRGIDTRRPLVRPSAFPADEPAGCQPPAGWTAKR